MQKWNAFKGDLPFIISGDWSPKLSWESDAATVEDAKATLYKVLQDYVGENAVGPNDVALCGKPQALRAKRDFKKGELILTPFAFMSSFTTTAKGNLDIGHKHGEVKLYVAKPGQPSEVNVGDWKENATVNPFFGGVDSVSQKEKATVSTKAVKVKDVTFKVFHNIKNINAMDPIVYFKPVVKAAPLAGAVVETSVEAKDETSASPKKKAKK